MTLDDDMTNTSPTGATDADSGALTRFTHRGSR